MKSKVRGFSYLVDNQLPSFIKDEYPKFSSFLEKYYEYLDLPGNPIDIINNLAKYRDVDSYDRNSLTEETTFVSLSTTNNSISITVEDASSFPNANGYILIQGEAVFYKEREGNVFKDCYRNINATTKLGDLYEPSTTTNISPEDSGSSDRVFTVGSVVKNISNLFLFALVKNFEKEYLGSFPESSLKNTVNKNILIKNIKDFYRVKGTEKSIQFIFNSIISQSDSDVPNVYYPKDFTFKSSNGTWITKYGLKVKLISGNPENIVGSRLVQKSPDNKKTIAFGVIDNVIDIGETFYEIILSTSTIVGEFEVAAQTKLTKELLSTDTQIVDVYSTLGWNNFGRFYVNGEEVSFDSKNVNQFTDIVRQSPVYHSEGSEVYNEVIVTAEYEGVSGNIETLTAIPLGVVYNLNVGKNVPYLKENDFISVTESGRNISDIQIIDKETNSIRWRLNESLDNPYSTNPSINQDLNRVLSDVSAIFEDSQYFYITSSGYPSHTFGKVSWDVELSDQKHLKIIKRSPSVSTNVTQIQDNEVGVLLNGVTVRSHKDDEKIVFGEIQEITVTSQGRGYLDPPYVLVEDSTGVGVASAVSVLSGEVVERVEVLESGSAFFPPVPTVTITSGRNATASPVITNGKITSIRIDNPGEYYSTPPKVIIRDFSGKGKNAEYISEISDDGKVINLKQIKEGKDYSQEETTVTLEAVGSGATGVSNVRTWTRNRYLKFQNNLDTSNGHYFLNNAEGIGYGYSYLANPKGLRVQLQDNLDSNYVTPTILSHSPIIGYAYDGYPIYGPYGYSNPLDQESSIQRMTSSYSLKNSRPLGPSTIEYPLGYFIEDYQYIHRSGSLDENNGRYCVTPEYPQGTYAYFITIDAQQNPLYPYILGENFYGIPVDSNYKKITQNDIPRNINRIKTGETPENGTPIIAKVEEINSGSVGGITVKESNNIFSNGNTLYFDYQNQPYTKEVFASVNEVEGKDVLSLHSVENKCLQISTKNTAYLFKNNLLYQENTNAYGTILGDVTNDTNIVLTDVSGSFDDTNKLYSNIVVASLLLNTSSFFTSGSVVTLSNGKQAGVEKVENNAIFLPQNPFENGERIIFTKSFSNVLQDTPYFVINAEATSFKVSTTQNGAAVTLTPLSTPPGSLVLSEQAKGEVLQSLQGGNTLIVKVIRGEFIVDDEYLIRSSNIFDTSNSQVSTIRYLHNNIEITFLNDKIAVATTDENHLLTEGDQVNVDINPDDSEKTTEYYVRRRIYQKVKLPSLVIEKQLKDNGVGSLKILNGGGYYVYDQQGNVSNVEGDYANGGDATYNNIELIFADQNLCRKLDGNIIIGNPNNPNNAKATINVTNGIVTSFAITSKGKFYKKGDILTVNASSIGRQVNSSNTRSFLAEVEHVGFHTTNTKLFLDNLESLSQNNLLKINDELVKITSINANEGYVTVSRAQENTIAQNHFDLAKVVVYQSGFLLQKDFKIGNQTGSPYVNEYDRENETLEVYFDVDSSLFSIKKLMSNMTFFDQSSPAKVVTVSDILEDPNYKFEFSLDNQNWSKNPIIDIQSFYKYKFNTNHYSMIGSFIDFSPSGNYNIIPNNVTKNDILPGYPGSYIDIKTGYGEQTEPLNTTIKKPIEYGNYFYYDKSGQTSPDGGYLKIVSDPLQGSKTISYVTDTSFVYNVDSLPLYDGSGDISYTTTSKSAIGKIKSVNITNSGSGFVELPLIKGISPNKEYECIVDVNWSSVGKNIASLIILNAGQNYIHPIAIVTDGDGRFAEFDVKTDQNGSIVSITVINKGSGYTYKPTVKIIETGVELYPYSDTIGTLKSIKLIDNGKGYNNDLSISRSFYTPTFLILEDFTGDFLEGEIISQYVGDIEVAKGKVLKYGWRERSNILKIDVISGVFNENQTIVGSIKKSEGSVKSVLRGFLYPNIKSYYDNLGYYSSDRSKLGSLSQRLADSYFYQDYSYVIESDTQVNDWRNVIKETTHPAGFVSFGEVNIRSIASVESPQKSTFSTVRLLQLWDDESSDRIVTVQSTTVKITETIAITRDSNVMRGKGSILPLEYDSAETISYDFYLDPPFNGYFDSNGNRAGTKTFTMKLKSSNLPLNVSNVNNLIITLDGILQEPNIAYTVSGTQIIFSQAPLGNRSVFGDPISSAEYVEGVDTKAQSFIGRYVGFKDTTLNTEYFRKIKNINDQFDGVKYEFELYYEDDTPVVLSSNDNLFVSLDGVLQVPGLTPLIPLYKSYYINRTVTPNTLVFTEAPKIEEEIPQSFFAYRVSSYISLDIDRYLIPIKKTGPFILRSVLNRKSVFIDDERSLFVFVDNVLQRRNKSYFINGSSITFSEDLQENAKIDIFYLYGRDYAKFATAFGFEDTPFLNRYNITVSQFQINLNYGYGEYVNCVVDAVDDSFNVLASARLIKVSKENTNYVLTVESAINRKIKFGDNLIVRQIRTNFGNTDVYIADFKVLSVEDFKENDDTIDIINKIKPGWLIGTSRNQIYDDNIELNDLIKIDGEEEYRTIRSIPTEAFKTQYRDFDDVNNNYYAKFEVSSYNNPQKGEGLLVIANVNTDEDSDTYGQITSLTWNKKDYDEYVQTDIFPQPNAYGYEDCPEIVFIPQPVKDDGGSIISPAQGGGAKAYAIMHNGEIIDIVLLSGGSDYLTSPKTYISYGYDIVKSSENLTNTYTSLSISPFVSTGINLFQQITVNIPTLTVNKYNTSIPFVSPLSSDYQHIEYIFPETKSAGDDFGWKETKINIIMNLSANMSSFSDIKSIIRIHLETPLQNVESISTLEHSSVKTAYVESGVVDSYGDEDYFGRYGQQQLGSPLGYYDFNGLQFADVGFNNASALTIEMLSNFYPNLTIGDFEIKSESNYTQSKDYWNIGRNSVTEYGALLDIGIDSDDDVIYISGDVTAEHWPTKPFASSGVLLIGDELVYYSSKLTDRFLDVIRGINGTAAQTHDAGSYLRTTTVPIDVLFPVVIDSVLYNVYSYVYVNPGRFLDIEEPIVLTRTGTFTLE
jgi:hypothetical protein